MRSRNIILAILLLSVNVMYSQYYDTGADPASTDWKQIKTDYFQIIFPKGYEEKAQAFASKMDYAYDFVNETMKSKPRKLSVIIHTQSAISNGMVAWVPRRMELWTVPSQDAFNYSQEWMEQLIIHETRHFVQENKMNQGFTKVLKLILGEQAEMIPLGMMTRQWFMEGDAVASETALSHSGRGRMPSFEQGLRALVLEQGSPSYDVAHLGTYNHYMPNHYEVGYHTVAVSRLTKDSLIFDKKMDDIGKFKTLRGLRDSRKQKYYGDAISYLDHAWREQDSLLEKTPFTDILPSEGDYARYEFLQEDEGRLYAIRNTLSHMPEIVEVGSNGDTKVVLERGWTSESDFSVRKGKLAFADNMPDPRWDQRSFADIFVVDIETKKRQRLTHKQVMQAPSFNSDATKIVAQKVNGNGEFVLQIYDVKAMRLLAEIPNPTKQFYFTPKWSPDDTKIVYVGQEKDKKALKYYDLETKSEVVLLEGTYGELAHPLWYQDKVYFTASYSGINNIYSCDTNDKVTKRVSSSRFGADYATVWNDSLVFANYSSSGFKPVVHHQSDIAGETLDMVEDMGLGLADKLTAQEGTTIDFTQRADTLYEVRNYSRFTHLFHVHSWMPAATSSSGDNLYPGITLQSQNKLSTSFLTATYNGDPSMSAGKYKLAYNYNGFYPKLGLNVFWGDYSSEYQKISYDVDVFTVQPQISLPLVYKKGVFSHYLTTTVFGEYQRHYRSVDDAELTSFDVGALWQFTRVKQAAIRDLFSPTLQSLVLRIDKTDADFYEKSWRYSLSFKAYTSGFAAHHSFQYGLSLQEKDLYHSNIMTMPKGYTSSFNSKIVYGTTSYYLPLWYPDMHLGSVVNLKRCAMGLYGDLASITDDVATDVLYGAGGSVFVDVNFLRYEVDFRIGVQAGVASYQDDLITPVNLILNFNVF